MKATKTKKMMITATFLTMTACAGVDESNVPPTGDDTGSDMQPAGTVTIDSSEFVVDGSMWWSTTAAPRIHGTFDAPAGTMIVVKVGDAPAVTATLAGTEWSAQLAPNSIATSYTMLTVTMTAPNGTKVELAQAIGLDSAPPAILLMPSTVRDERGDQISFTSGEPVHAHTGNEIDLAQGACPTVYKYAYLMAATAPLYGSQGSPNDLAWHVKILDAKRDAAAEQYRVRSDNGQTLINWTAMPAADASGAITIKLDRANAPLLGTRAGQYFIDLKAKDQTNLETTSTACVDFHPLQAPIQVMPMEKGELFGLKLGGPDNEKLAGFVTDKFVPIATQKIIQRTAEKVHISWTPHATGSTTGTSFGGWVTIRDSSAFYGCPVGTTDTKCTDWKPTGMPGLSTVTDNSAGDIAAFIIDDENGETVAANAIDIDIQPRKAGEPPHSYTLVVRGRAPFLKPPTLTGFDPVGPQTLGGTPYIGQAPSYIGRACLDIVDSPIVGRTCTFVVDYYYLTAIDHDIITYSDISATMKVGGEVPTYVPEGTMTLSNLMWDSGDQYVPGGMF